MDKINHEVTEDFLFRVPIPAATESYVPVRHSTIVEEIQNQLISKGLVISNKKYRAADNGEKAYGEFLLTTGNSEMGLMLAFQNSYDKSLTVKLAAGASIFICSNGAVRGDILTFKRKHTGSVSEELNYYIEVAINGLEENFRNLERDFARLKEIEITKRISAELIGRMYVEEDIIKSTQLNIIKRELEHPSYEQFISPTAFNLYQHVTHSLKSAHPSDLITTHVGVHNFFTEVFAL